MKICRKTILLGSIILLSLIYCLQLLMINRNVSKNFVLDEDFDRICISRTSGDIFIRRNGEDWLIGENQYPMDKNVSKSMEDLVKNISVLDEVSSKIESSQFGFDENAIYIDVMNGEKKLRHVKIGKSLAASSMSYVEIDDGKVVSLVSGDYSKIFGKTVDEMREKLIYSFNESDFEKVTVVKDNESFSVVKDNDSFKKISSKEDSVIEEDDKNYQLKQWVSSLMTLRAKSFTDDAAFGNEVLKVFIYLKDSRKIELSFCMVNDENIVSCSESKYLFSVSDYVKELFEEDPLKDTDR